MHASGPPGCHTFRILMASWHSSQVVALTELQGLGPKRVKTLFETLGVKDRASLEAAARAGKLRELPGFGEKVEQNVLKSLATASQKVHRFG